MNVSVGVGFGLGVRPGEGAGVDSSNGIFVDVSVNMPICVGARESVCERVGVGVVGSIGVPVDLYTKLFSIFNFLVMVVKYCYPNETNALGARSYLQFDLLTLNL